MLITFDEAPHSAEIHILFCANHSYFQHLTVAAVSLAEASRRSRILIHVMTYRRHEIVESKLVETLHPYEKIAINFHYVGDIALPDVLHHEYITKETHLRLLVAEVLPRNIQRIIYLDCDMVILDDIEKLWRLAYE